MKPIARTSWPLAALAISASLILPMTSGASETLVVMDADPPLTGTPALSKQFNSWHFGTTLQGSHSRYNDSQTRDTANSAGIILSADYLEHFGITLGYNRTEVEYLDGSDTLEQDAFYTSLRRHITPDRLQGRLTLRLDGHLIDNNDPTQTTDEVKAIAPQIAYTNFERTFYWDLGYAHSNYWEDLNVSQWTPTLGFGFNNGRDWMQFRGYFIDSSNIDRSQGESNLQALETKWTHWTDRRHPAMPSKATLSALIGERQFTVDPDAAEVSNLSDVEEGGLSLAADWALNDHTNVMLLAGRSWYENRELLDQYTKDTLYMNVAIHW
jgi:hypothetical protein